jgi:hypothetical protein
MNDAQKALRDKLIQYIIHRAKEPVTWVQLLTVIGTITGITIRPELTKELATIGVSIAGAIGVLLPTPLSEQEKPKDPEA